MRHKSILGGVAECLANSSFVDKGEEGTESHIVSLGRQMGPGGTACKQFNSVNTIAVNNVAVAMAVRLTDRSQGV